jgi:hypothetical protein
MPVGPPAPPEVPSPPGRFRRRLLTATGLLTAALASHVWLVGGPSPRRTVPVAPTAAPSDRGVTAAPTEPPVFLSYEDIIPNIVRERAPAPEQAPAPAPPATAPRAEPLGPTRLAARGLAESPIAVAAEHASPGEEVALPALRTESLQPEVAAALHGSAPDLSPPARRRTPAPLLTSAPRLPETTESPAAARSAVAETAVSVSDRDIVLEIVREYRRAYEQLDVKAAKAVWPSVDERELARAFQQLQGQQLAFTCSEISISGQDANARCSGNATYRPKVGSRVVRLTGREWTFNLSRGDSGWQIAQVTLH